MNDYHPADTIELIRLSKLKIDNFALHFQHSMQEDSRSKYKLKLQNTLYKLEDSSVKLVEQLRERQTTQLQQLAKRGIELYCVNATVDWRLVVGLGSEHVQETNMTLHHIYGIPYIPGSGVKGVLNHWWFQELQAKKDFIDGKGNVNETEAMKDSEYLDYIKTFGSQEQRGEVQFLDAYPEKVQFKTDIMNPHYSDYYSEKSPPTDHQNPRPILFLTIEKTSFRFAFLAKDKKFLTKLKDRLQEALELKGVGAKTAVGYGYFRCFKDQTATIIGKANPQKQIGQQSTTSNG